METGYKRPRGPKEGFDPEVNWYWLSTFAGWEGEGEPEMEELKEEQRRLDIYDHRHFNVD